MMKKYLMTSVAALAVAATFTSCHKDFDVMTPEDFAKAKYNAAFTNYVGGSIAANQDWGFSDDTRGITRSMAAPSVPEMSQAPYDEAWVATYNQTAKEPNSTNVTDNYDNSVYHEGTPGTYAANYNTIDDWEVWNGMWQYGDWDAQVAWLLANGKEYWLTYTPGTEGYWEYDETFVRNFKITDTYDGAISVVATEGLTDGVANGNERTVVVTGTWNITENQRVGSKGRIIIANGGTVNVAEGVTLNMVNQARLVVLSGGKLTGAGKVEVNNGNAAGLENYNGGTIDVATFNNNFGKFYNYGKFLVNEYDGGAAESNFYNHALAAIDHFGIYDSSTANARIFNACQFYVKNDARIRNYEGVGGSALIVDGELMFSSSEDGTSTPTYVGLAAGALVQCKTLYNNGTSWSGPTSGGYAALNITDKITFLNWEQDAPQNGGYFANNIYVVANTWDNVPDGNGYHQTDPSDAANYALSIADYKFWNVIANCTGNGGVTKATIGTKTLVVGADEDGFVKGVKGCTPGFSVNVPEKEVFNIRIIGEDLSASSGSDFDFNDIVIDLKYDDTNAVVLLQAAGGTLPLRFGNGDDKVWEVHELFGVDQQVMVNTNAQKTRRGKYATKPAVRQELGYGIASATEAKNKLIIEVLKDDQWCELTAETAEPAAKIAVDTDYQWLDERTSIKEVYPSFVSWVQNPERNTKWWK